MRFCIYFRECSKKRINRDDEANECFNKVLKIDPLNIVAKMALRGRFYTE